MVLFGFAEEPTSLFFFSKLATNFTLQINIYMHVWHFIYVFLTKAFVENIQLGNITKKKKKKKSKIKTIKLLLFVT